MYKLLFIETVLYYFQFRSRRKYVNKKVYENNLITVYILYIQLDFKSIRYIRYTKIFIVIQPWFRLRLNSLKRNFENLKKPILTAGTKRVQLLNAQNLCSL